MDASELLLQRLQQQLAQLGTGLHGHLYAGFFRHIAQLVLHGDFAVQKFTQVKALGQRNAAEAVEAVVTLRVKRHRHCVSPFHPARRGCAALVRGSAICTSS